MGGCFEYLNNLINARNFMPKSREKSINSNQMWGGKTLFSYSKLNSDKQIN